MKIEHYKYKINIFLGLLSQRENEILNSFDPDTLSKALIEFALAQPGVNEIEIFVGYHRNNDIVYAVYISDCPGNHVILLSQRVAMERMNNLRKDMLPREQTERALKGWPSSDLSISTSE